MQRHLGRHVPGAPSIAGSSMAGAAGKILARHVYTVAPRDGTVIGLPFANALFEPMLGAGAASYDATKFVYAGSASMDESVCMASRDGPVADFRGVSRREAATGALSPGTPSGDVPKIAASLTGAKFRIVRGYSGFQGLSLAIERGEVDVICPSWAVVKPRYPGILEGKSQFRVFLRGGSDEGSEPAKAGAPSLASLASTDLDRAAVELYMAQFRVASPFLLPPNVSPAAATVLRKAFAETVTDPEYLADARGLNADVAFTSGEDIQRLLARVYDSDARVVARLKQALAGD